MTTYVSNMFYVFRWQCIPKHDIESFGGDIVSNFKFEFFIYLQKRRRGGPVTYRRATQARIESCRQQLLHEFPGMGPIQMHLASVNLARQNEDTQRTIPDNPAM